MITFFKTKLLVSIMPGSCLDYQILREVIDLTRGREVQVARDKNRPQQAYMLIKKEKDAG